MRAGKAAKILKTGAIGISMSHEIPTMLIIFVNSVSKWAFINMFVHMNFVQCLHQVKFQGQSSDRKLYLLATRQYKIAKTKQMNATIFGYTNAIYMRMKTLIRIRIDTETSLRR